MGQIVKKENLKSYISRQYQIHPVTFDRWAKDAFLKFNIEGENQEFTDEQVKLIVERFGPPVLKFAY